MRSSTLVFGLASVLLGSACAGPLEGARPAGGASARPSIAAAPAPLTDHGSWQSAADAPAAPPSRVLFQQQQRASILIGEKAPPPDPVRPRSRGRVDVSFHRADLGNALRFLADSGRFNLVVEAGLSGAVTAELHGVDAFDALVTIAEANGAGVRYHRGIVLVKKASAAP